MTPTHRAESGPDSLIGDDYAPTHAGPDPAEGPRPAPAGLPRHVTQPLLDRIMTQALDGAYVDRARRRRDEAAQARAAEDGADRDVASRDVAEAPAVGTGDGGASTEAASPRAASTDTAKPGTAETGTAETGTAETGTAETGTDTRRGTGAPGRSRSMLLTAVVVAVFGIMVATSIVQQDRDASTRASGRDALTTQIQDHRESIADAQDELGALRSTTARLAAQVDVLADDQQEAEALQRQRGMSTGFAAVTGPGVRITVGDSSSGLDSERVVDADLATLANALWGIGAEAISINGQRLTALSSIRNSGWAIHVNNQPLRSPYVVEAIGDPLTMLSDFADSDSGSRFLGLVEFLNFEFDQENVDELHLAAARPRMLSHAVYGMSESADQPENSPPAGVDPDDSDPDDGLEDGLPDPPGAAGAVPPDADAAALGGLLSESPSDASDTTPSISSGPEDEHRQQEVQP